MLFWVAGITVVALVVIFYGFRRSWITPLPGVRVAMSRPIVKASAFGPDSAYQLLMAAAEPPELTPPEEHDPAWLSGWSEALGKLNTRPWPTALPPPDPPAASPPEWGPMDTDGMFVDDDTPWTRAQFLDIQRVLELYQPRFPLLDRALAAPDPQMPTMTPDDMVSIEYTMPSRQLSRALILCAHRQAAAGDAAGAYRDLLRSARLGNLVARGGPLISSLICGSFLGESCEGARHIALRYGGSSDVLRRAAEDYLACADAMEPMAETIRAEALFSREYVVRSYDSGLGSLRDAYDLAGPTERWCPGEWTCGALARFGWLVGSTPRRTARTVDAFFQHLISLAERPYSAAVAAELGELGHRLDARSGMVKALLCTWDPVGCLAVAGSFGTWQHALGRSAKSRAQMRGTALLLAVKAYETERGTLPEGLAQLVPDYLPRVPVDPFDGKPFRYLRSGVPGLPAEAWAVYSIGGDFTDDGGTAQTEGSVRNEDGTNPDLVWPSHPYPQAPPTPQNQ